MSGRNLNLNLALRLPDLDRAVRPEDVVQYLAAFIENRDHGLPDEVRARIEDAEGLVLGFQSSEDGRFRPICARPRDCRKCGGTGFSLTGHEEVCSCRALDEAAQELLDGEDTPEARP